MRSFLLSITVGILSFALTTSPARAQIIKDSNLVQSTYYDAMAYYYAMDGYTAYPLLIKAATKVIAGSGVNVGPGPISTQKVNIYKIIESATGKVLLDEAKEDTLQALMAPYHNNPDDTAILRSLIKDIRSRNDGGVINDSLLEADYATNTYLYDSKNFLKTRIQFAGGATTEIPDIGKGLPTVSQLAEGLADFYIQRVNDEINDAFFVRLQEVLGKVDELRILFPKTLESLNKLQATSYNQSLNAIKSAYQTDIKNLLYNISGLATIDKYQHLINKYPELTLLFTSCDLIALIKDGHTPADIIWYISRSPYIQKVDPNVYNFSIKLAAELSYSVTDLKIGDGNTSGLNWLSPGALKIFVQNKDIFRIFMGLFAQHAKGVQLDKFNFRQALIDNKDRVLAGQYIIYNTSETFNNITNRISAFNGASATLSGRVGLYIDVANEIVNLADKSIGVLPSNATINERNLITKVKQVYIPFLQKTDTVISHIEKKEYSMAIYEADTLLGMLFNKQESLNLTTLQPKAAIDSNTKLNSTRQDFLHYGLFIAAIAESKDANDVKAAISAFALPKGSSRIKKQHNFSWGLQSYVGVYHSWNTKYNGVELPGQEWGITAPLGLALNWGHFAGGSLSVYGGIIDIGAIFTYKVSNPDSTVSSDIKLGQLLSPSLGLVYGLPIIKKYNIPLSIGANYQWGPTLRKVDPKGNSTLPLLAGRFNVFIAVDIPILNFHVSKD